MPYNITGTLYMGIDPSDSSTSSLNRFKQFQGSRKHIASVNEPLIISAYWGGLNENEEPLPSNYWPASQQGDVVNCIFDIYQCNDLHTVGAWTSDWTLVSSIRKSRDIRNISERDIVAGGDGTAVAAGHKFTVDISEVCKDLLSYSLLPHGKGTWATPEFGGLNGGASQQDNVMQFIAQNNWILTRNGSWRTIRVRVRTEIIDSNGIIREATAAGSFKDMANEMIIINSAPDFDNSNVDAVHSLSDFWGYFGHRQSTNYPRSMMTHARNGIWNTYATSAQWARVAKDVRMDESMEQLQWVHMKGNQTALWTASGWNPNNTNDLVNNAYIQVTAYNAAFVEQRKGRLFDWNQNLIPKTTVAGLSGVWPRGQRKMCAQNVSPVFINANIIHEDSAVQDIWENGGQTYTRRLIDVDGNAKDTTALFLNDDIEYYEIQIVTETKSPVVVNDFMSERRYYKIDRERWGLGSEYYSNAEDVYGGIYYTELRDDYATNALRIRCKGYLWNNKPSGDFFRIYWLNKAGAIDAYTIKGTKSISYNAERDIIQRQEPNRFNWQPGVTVSANPYPSGTGLEPVSASYRSDMMGRGDNHKGGLEVLSVNATKSGIVTTRPLNERKAEWLREILTSPNVWTEVQTQGTGQARSGGATLGSTDAVYSKIANRSTSNISQGKNMDGRTPNNMEYVPIVITNSSVDTYDNEQGLITMTFEYTHAHAVVTQRN